MYALGIYANEPFQHTIVSSLRLDINASFMFQKKHFQASRVNWLRNLVGLDIEVIR
jgi:hypothetical protein